MQWEVVIGLETHAQLSTVSKIFSGASTHFGEKPNTQACPVDLALPGVLPVMNRGAVEKAIQFGLAIGAQVAPVSVFARKNYFYPDLPKGYQISQFEKPVVIGGKINCIVEQKGKNSYIKTINKEITRKREEFKLETLEIGQTLASKRSDQVLEAMEYLTSEYIKEGNDKYSAVSSAVLAAKYAIANSKINQLNDAALSFKAILDSYGITETMTITKADATPSLWS